IVLWIVKARGADDAISGWLSIELPYWGVAAAPAAMVLISGLRLGATHRLETPSAGRETLLATDPDDSLRRLHSFDPQPHEIHSWRRARCVAVIAVWAWHATTKSSARLDRPPGLETSLSWQVTAEAERRKRTPGRPVDVGLC